MIDDDTRTALKAAACSLHLKRIDRMVIASDVCGGIIQTNWDSHIVGGRSGILFRCHVEREDGDFFVNFLLSTQDLESGADILREMEERSLGHWHAAEDRFPVEELYQFSNLRKRTLH